MAKDIRGLGRVNLSSVIDTSATGNPFTTFAENIRGGGMGNYNDSERDAIDGRIIDNNMFIFNTSPAKGYYEYYSGGTRNDSGFMTGGMWQRLQFAGGAIDSDDSDSRRNHTAAIITGRGLGFNTSTPDSELEITANRVEVFGSLTERDNHTGVWSRGDIALVTGQAYYTGFGSRDVGIVNDPTSSLDSDMLIFGVTADEFAHIVASGRVADNTSGAQNRSILEVRRAYTAGRFSESGYGQYNLGQGVVRLSGPARNIPHPGRAVFYLTEHGGLFGGTYFFYESVDQNGPTTSENWRSIIFDQSGRNAILQEFRQADSEINTRLLDLERFEDSDRDALADEIAARLLSDDSDALGIRNLQRQLTEQNTTDTELRVRIAAEELKRNDVDSDLSDRIDSDQIALDRLKDRVDNIEHGHARVINGEHFNAGYGVRFERTDSDSDTIVIDSDQLDSDFRLVSLNLQGYQDVPVVSDLDTERVVISGNINTFAPDSDNDPNGSVPGFTIGRGRLPVLSGNQSFFNRDTHESTIDINGTYIRDPRTTKILRVTNDRAISGTQLAQITNVLNETGAGAEVVATVADFHSYWNPDGGGLDGGLSIVATDDRGIISRGDERDSNDSDLPLNWRIVRGRWFDDAQYQVGQNFPGSPIGTPAAPICTFNLFSADSDYSSVPIGTLRDSDNNLDYVAATFGSATQPPQMNIVGGGSAVYAPRNTSQEFFRTIFDPLHGATREYVDGRLTEEGITNLIGNTETLVTYSRPLTSFPRPFNPDLPGNVTTNGNTGHQLPQNTFLLKSTPYAVRDGRRIAGEGRYLLNDIGPGESLSDARELWVRGSTDIFRNILGKIVEDSVILFSDSDGTNKFYWTVQSAAQQAFNENLYVISPKAVKYATGALDTDSTYQVYLKPNADDLVPGDRVVPETIQPLALHLRTGDTLQDGRHVTVRREGSLFLFGIEEETGGGATPAAATSEQINSVVNTLELGLDSDSDNLQLFGNTTELTPAVPGTRSSVSVTFTGTGDSDVSAEIGTIITPAGDTETFTVGNAAGSTRAAKRARGLFTYLTDNAIGQSIVNGTPTIATNTVAWQFNQVGDIDTDSDAGSAFFRLSSTEDFDLAITTQGTDTIPATFGRGLITQTAIPDIEFSARNSLNSFGGSDGAELVLIHGSDSEEIMFENNPADGITWTGNDFFGRHNINLDLDLDRIVSFAQVESAIGNPNTLVTDAIYTKRLTTPDSEGQIQYLSDSDDPNSNVSNIADARALKIRPLNALHRTITSRMHAGSRIIVSLVGNPANALYATITGLITPTISGPDSENYIFLLEDSSASIHFANGTVAEGDQANFYLKPASRDIITGVDITPRSIAHTHILPDVLTPDLLRDDGVPANSGRVLSVTEADPNIFAWTGIHAVGLSGAVFDSDSDGLVPHPQAGQADSEYYLSGQGDWQLVPRSRIVFNDAEVDIYSDLFRIDYRPDSDELVFSAQSDVVDSETRVENAGITTFVPPSGNLFITDTHLVLGPTYRIDIPANIFNNNAAYEGTFTDFYLSNDGRHTIIDSDRLTDVSGTRPPNGFFARSGVTLTFTVTSVSRLQSRIPIIAEDFDSEKRGLVPAPGDSDDNPYRYLAGDGTWQHLGSNLDSEFTSIRNDVIKLEREVNDGIGSIPVGSDSDYRGPREFMGLDVADDGRSVTISTYAKDSEAWSALDDFIADQLSVGPNLPSLTMGVTVFRRSPNRFVTYRLNMLMNRNDTGIAEYVSSNNTFILRTNLTGPNGEIRVVDVDGNTVADPTGNIYGGGYFTHFEAYSATDQHADLANQLDNLGDPHYAYSDIYNERVPIIIDRDATNTPEVRFARLGAGLSFDTDSDAIVADVSSTFNLRVDNQAEDLPPPTGTSLKSNVSYLRLINHTLNVHDVGGESIVQASAFPVPKEYTATANFELGELVYDSEGGDLHRVRISGGLFPGTQPPIDSEYFFQRLGRSSHLTPTELIGASQNPEVFTETGPATITGTDTGTYIQFETSDSQRRQEFTIFYIRNASNVLQRAEVYSGTHTTPPATGRLALRTYRTTPLGNTGWTDSE